MIRYLGYMARIAGKAVVRYNRNDGSAMAGYIAYTSLLAVFPFLIFASAMAGSMIGADQSDKVIDSLFQLLPEHIALTIQPVAREVLSQPGGGVITLSAIGAIWVASTGFEAFRIAFDRAYDAEDKRPFWITRGLSVLLVFLATAVFVMLGVVVIVGPLIRRMIDEYFEAQMPFGASTLLYFVSALVLAVFLLLLHRVLPSRRLKTPSLLPGVIVTGVIWMSAASVFSIYLRYAPNYTITYGALAGVIITLLFFYVSGAAIIYGAEINAALDIDRKARRAAKEELRSINDSGENPH